MGKRIRLPELKKVVNKTHSHLVISNPSSSDGQSGIMHSLVHIDTPNCYKYEVRYRQSNTGRYTASFGFCGGFMKIYEGNAFIQIACFIPDSWVGKKFNRTVKVLA